MAESDFLGFPIYILPDIPEGHELFFHVTGVYEYCGPEGEKPFGKWVYDKAANAVKQTAPNGDVYIYRLGGEGNFCETERHFTKDGVRCCEKGAVYVPEMPPAELWQKKSSWKYNSRGQYTEHIRKDTSETVEYDAEGKILAYTHYLEPGYLGSERKYIYNEDGKLAEIRKNERNIGHGYGDYQMYQYRTILTYDDAGRKIAETDCDSDGNPQGGREYGDGERLLFEWHGDRRNPSQSSEYEYDEAGRLKRDIFRFDGKTILQETRYSYPADGSTYKRWYAKRYNSDEKMFLREEKTTDSAGRFTRIKSYDHKRGELYEDQQWEYDKNGELVRIVVGERNKNYPERWTTSSTEYGYLRDCKVKQPLQSHDLINGRAVTTKYSKYCWISPNVVMNISYRENESVYSVSYDEYDNYGNRIGYLLLWEGGRYLALRNTYEPFVAEKGYFTEGDRRQERCRRDEH
jgi:hypothetical protein